MVQARRAKAQPARIIIPLAVAAALLVGGLFAAWKFWPDRDDGGPTGGIQHYRRRVASAKHRRVQSYTLGHR